MLKRHRKQRTSSNKSGSKKSDMGSSFSSENDPNLSNTPASDSFVKPAERKRPRLFKDPDVSDPKLESSQDGNFSTAFAVSSQESSPVVPTKKTRLFRLPKKSTGDVDFSRVFESTSTNSSAIKPSRNTFSMCNATATSVPDASIADFSKAFVSPENVPSLPARKCRLFAAANESSRSETSTNFSEMFSQPSTADSSPVKPVRERFVLACNETSNEDDFSGVFGMSTDDSSLSEKPRRSIFGRCEDPDANFSNVFSRSTDSAGSDRMNAKLNDLFNKMNRTESTETDDGFSNMFASSQKCTPQEQSKRDLVSSGMDTDLSEESQNSNYSGREDVVSETFSQSEDTTLMTSNQCSSQSGDETANSENSLSNGNSVVEVSIGEVSSPGEEPLLEISALNRSRKKNEPSNVENSTFAESEKDSSTEKNDSSLEENATCASGGKEVSGRHSKEVGNTIEVSKTSLSPGILRAETSLEDSSDVDCSVPERLPSMDEVTTDNLVTEISTSNHSPENNSLKKAVNCPDNSIPGSSVNGTSTITSKASSEELDLKIPIEKEDTLNIEMSISEVFPSIEEVESSVTEISTSNRLAGKSNSEEKPAKILGDPVSVSSMTQLPNKSSRDTGYNSVTSRTSLNLEKRVEKEDSSNIEVPVLNVFSLIGDLTTKNPVTKVSEYVPSPANLDSRKSLVGAELDCANLDSSVQEPSVAAKFPVPEVLASSVSNAVLSEPKGDPPPPSSHTLSINVPTDLSEPTAEVPAPLAFSTFLADDSSDHPTEVIVSETLTVPNNLANSPNSQLDSPIKGPRSVLFNQPRKSTLSEPGPDFSTVFQEPDNFTPVGLVKKKLNKLFANEISKSTNAETDTDFSRAFFSSQECSLEVSARNTLMFPLCRSSIQSVDAVRDNETREESRRYTDEIHSMSDSSPQTINSTVPSERKICSQMEVDFSEVFLSVGEVTVADLVHEGTPSLGREAGKSVSPQGTAEIEISVSRAVVSNVSVTGSEKPDPPLRRSSRLRRTTLRSPNRTNCSVVDTSQPEANTSLPQSTRSSSRIQSSKTSTRRSRASSSNTSEADLSSAKSKVKSSKNTTRASNSNTSKVNSPTKETKISTRNSVASLSKVSRLRNSVSRYAPENSIRSSFGYTMNSRISCLPSRKSSNTTVFSLSKMDNIYSDEDETEIPLAAAQLFKKPKVPIARNKDFISKPNFPQFDMFCNDNFYKVLIKKMEPTFGIYTNSKVVKLAKFICDMVNDITYSKEDPNEKVDVMKTLLFQHGIVVTHFDFNMFCLNYLPIRFKFRALPMWRPYGLPSIVKFDPDTLHDPIG